MVDSNYGNSLSDEEALEIINKLKKADYESEGELDEALGLLVGSYPGISDLIFCDKRDLSAQEILQEAKMKNKPILL